MACGRCFICVAACVRTHARMRVCVHARVHVCMRACLNIGLLIMPSVYSGKSLRDSGKISCQDQHYLLTISCNSHTLLAEPQSVRGLLPSPQNKCSRSHPRCRPGTRKDRVQGTDTGPAMGDYKAPIPGQRRATWRRTCGTRTGSPHTCVPSPPRYVAWCGTAWCARKTMFDDASRIPSNHGSHIGS